MSDKSSAPVQLPSQVSAATPLGTSARLVTEGQLSIGYPFALPYQIVTPGTGGSGTGTVTSVGLSLPTEFVVSGSPVTTAGTLAGTWATQAANVVFAGPATGAAATPAFRALVEADLPNLSGVYVPVSRTLTAGTGLSGGGDLSANRTFALADTTVTPGTYASADITVDAQGRLTAAANGVTLFWDPVDQGEYKGWSGLAGNYVWGTGWQALKALSVSGVKARTQATTGTLILSVWVGGVRVKTGSATITAAGVYTVTFSPVLAVTAGQLFTVSAYTAGGTIPYIDATQAEYEVTVAGPRVRLTNGRLYQTGDIEPTTTSGPYLFGVSPVIQ